VSAAVLNAAGGKKGGGLFEAKDCLLRWGEPQEEEATLEDLMTMLTRARVK
jgi:hypothetical protein